MNAYGRRPGPTLTGSGDGGVSGGEEEEEAALVLMATRPGRHVTYARSQCLGTGVLLRVRGMRQWEALG